MSPDSGPGEGSTPEKDVIDLSEEGVGMSEKERKRRTKLGEYAKELVWSDEEWELLRRYHAGNISPNGPLEPEELPLLGTRVDFSNEDRVNDLRRNAEWEPVIPSDDTIIRRYVTFDKFISILSNSGFWFSNISNFPDQFEASLPEPTVSHTQQVVDFEKERSNGPGQVSHGVNQRRKQDEHTYVSCWRMGGDESSVFWDAYIGDKKGLAIQTTVGKLREYLSEEIWSGYIGNLINEGWGSALSQYNKVLAGKVEYLEYESESISRSRLSPARYFHKRTGFEAEREFRLVKTVLPVGDYSKLPDSKPGLVVTGDLESIVDKIIFPPGKSGLYQNIVSDFANNSLQADVARSELEREPNRVDL